MRTAQRGHSVDSRYHLKGSESELNSQRERGPLSCAFAIQRAENSLLNIFWKHSVNVTPSVQGEIAEVFSTLKDNLRSIVPDTGYAPKDNRRVEVAQEDLRSLKERMAISTRSIYAAVDKIDLELSRLANSLKYKADTYSSEYLGPRRIRSSSQSTMKNPSESEETALKIKELRSEFSRLGDELKKKESYWREAEILSQRIAELLGGQSTSPSRTYAGEIHRKEDLMRQGELLRKDELIRKLQAELDASKYLLKRKNEEGGAGNSRMEQTLGELCSLVTGFLHTMQRLQRAIAKNDNQAIPGLQHEFEHRKKQLGEFTQTAKQQYGRSPVILRVKRRLEDTPGSSQGEDSLNSSLTKFKVRPVDDPRPPDRKVHSLELELMNCKKTIKEYKEIAESQVQQLNINKRTLENYVLSIDEKNKRIEELTQARIRLEKDCRRLADENRYKQIIIDQKIKEAASFADTFKQVTQENQALFERARAPQAESYGTVDKRSLKSLINNVVISNKSKWNDLNAKIAVNATKLNSLLKSLQNIGSLAVERPKPAESAEYDQKVAQLTLSLKKVQTEKAKMLQDLEEAEKKYKKAAADKQGDAEAKRHLQTLRRENEELKATLDGALGDRSELERLLRKVQAELKTSGGEMDRLKSENEGLVEKLAAVEMSSVVSEKSARKREKNIEEQALQCIDGEGFVQDVDDRLNDYEAKIAEMPKAINSLVRKYKDALKKSRDEVVRHKDMLKKLSEGTDEINLYKKQIDELSKIITNLQEENKDLKEQYSIQKDTLNQQWETIALKDEALQIAEQKHDMDTNKLKGIIANYNSKLALTKNSLQNFSNSMNDHFLDNENKIGVVTERMGDLLEKLPLVEAALKRVSGEEAHKRVIEELEEEKEQLLKDVAERREQEKYIIEEGVQELSRNCAERLAEIEERLKEVDKVDELKDAIEVIKETTRGRCEELALEARRASQSSALEKGTIVALRSDIKNYEASSRKVKDALEKVLRPNEPVDSVESLLVRLEERVESDAADNAALKEAVEKLSEDNNVLKVQVSELEMEVENQTRRNKQLGERVEELAKDRSLGEQTLIKENDTLKEQVNTLISEAQKAKAMNEEDVAGLKEELENTKNECMQEVTDLIEEKNQLQKELEDAKLKLADGEALKSQIEELNSKAQALTQENLNKAEEITKLNSELEEQRREFDELVEANNAAKEQAGVSDELSEQIAILQQELAKTKTDLDAAEKERNDTKDELQKIVEQVKGETAKEVAEYREKQEQLEEEIRLKKEVSEALSENLIALTNENTKFQEEVNNLRHRLEQAQAESEGKLADSAAKHESDIETLKKSIEDYKAKCEELSSLEDSATQLEDYKAKCAELEDKLKQQEELDSKMAEYESENKELRDKIDSLQKAAASNNEVEVIIQEHAKKDTELNDAIGEYKIINEQLKDEIGQYKEHIDKLSAEFEEYKESTEEKLKDNEKQIEELISELTSVNSINEELKEEAKRHKETSEALITEMDQHKAEDAEGQRQELEDMKKEFGDANAKLNEELESYKSNYSIIQAEHAQLQSDHDHLKREVEGMMKENEKLKEDIEAYKITINKLNEEIEGYKEKNEQLVNEMEDYKETSADLREELKSYASKESSSVEEHKQASEELKAQLSERKSNIKELQTALSALKSDNEKLEEDLNRYKKECENLTKDLEEHKNSYEGAISELESVREENRRVKEEFDAFKATNDQAAAEKNQSASREIEEYREKYSELESQLKQEKASYEQLNQELMKSVANADELANKHKQLEDTVADMKAESEREISSLQKALEELNNEKQSLEQAIEEYKTKGENLAAEKESSSQLQVQLEDSTKKCAELEEEVKALKEESGKLTQNIAKIAAENNELAKQFEDRGHQLQALEEANNELSSKMLRHEEEAIASTEELEKAKSLLADSERRQKELEDALKEKEGSASSAMTVIAKERDDLANTIEQLRNEINKSSERVKELEDEVINNDAQVAEWKKKCEEMAKLNDDLTSEKDKEKANIDVTLNQMRTIAEELQVEKERIAEANQSLQAETSNLKEEKEKLAKAVKELENDYDAKAEQCEQLIVESGKLTENNSQLQEEVRKGVEENEKLGEDVRRLEEKVSEMALREKELTDKVEALEKARVDDFDLVLEQSEERDKEGKLEVGKDGDLEEYKINLAEDADAKAKDSGRENSAEDELARVASERENYRMQVLSLTDIQDNIRQKLAEEGITESDPTDGVEELIQKYRKEFDDFTKVKEDIEESLSQLVELLPEEMQGNVTNQDELIAAITQVLTSGNKSGLDNSQVEKFQAELMEKNNQIISLQTQLDGLNNEFTNTVVSLTQKYDEAAEGREELDSVIDAIKKDLLEFVVRLPPSDNEMLVDRLLEMCRCSDEEVKGLKKRRMEQFGRKSLAL